MDGIEAALESAWEARENGEMPARRSAAREHALQYDADKILAEFWVPFLAELEDGLTGPRRRPAQPLPAGAPCGPR